MSKNVYITKSGLLKRNNNSLKFTYEENGESFKKDIPIKATDDIYIFSKTNINCDLLYFLSDNNINLHIFDFYSNYKGSYISYPKLFSGNILVKQVESYTDKTSRLNISKKILKSAKYNIIQNLKEYNIPIESLTNYDLDSCDSIPSLMGVEGNIRKFYYSKFNNIINGYKMGIRTKRPPSNEINCLLSFGNMLCYSEVIRAINKTSLSPTISYIHETQDGRSSLALDISETFKPILVDRTIFKCLNKKLLKKEHFDKSGNMCFLNDKGKRVFLREWDDKLQKTIYHKKLKRSVSYKQLIVLDVYKLMKFITEGLDYKPLKIWW